MADVAITAASDNNLLQYDSALGQWTNRTYLALNEIADPGLAPATEAWLHLENTAGISQLQLNDSVRSWAVMQDQFIIARNTSGGILAIGTAVKVTGSTGQRPEIAAADADTHDHAIGILSQALANNAFGRVQITGLVTGLDTSAFTAGQQLYVSSTAGVLTATPPSHPSSSQGVAVCIYSHANNGILFVFHHEDSHGGDASWADTFYIGSSLTDRAVFDITGSALTASRTFKFPDASGTLTTAENATTITGFWAFGAGSIDVYGSGSGTVYIGDDTAALNEKWYGLTSSVGTFKLNAILDAGGGEKAVLSVDRTGTTVASMIYGNATDFPTHAWWCAQNAANQFKFDSGGLQRIEFWGGTDYAGGGVLSDQVGGATTGSSWWEITTRGRTSATSNLEAGLWLGHVRGSDATHLASVSGDGSGEVIFWGNDSAATPTQSIFARIHGEVETVSATNLAGGIKFLTHSGTGARLQGQTERLHMKASGELALGTDGWFTFDEHASAPATPAAGRVALYAKDDGLLYSKDDAGLETVVTGGGDGGGGGGDASIPTFVRATSADQSVTSSTTLVTATDLTVDLEAGKKYIIEFHVRHQISAAGDFKGDFNYTGTATDFKASYHRWNTTGEVSGVFRQDLNALGTLWTWTVASLVDGVANFIVSITTTTAGTLSMRFAQNTSDATPAKVLRGSYIRAQEAPGTWGAGAVVGGGTSSEYIAVQATEMSLVSTAVATDTELTVALEAGIYEIEAFVACYAHATPDLEIQWAYTGTTSSVNMTRNAMRGTTEGIEQYAALPAVYTMTTTAEYGIHWHGMIVVSTSGTFKLQARQVTSSATADYIRKGSWLRTTKIDASGYIGGKITKYAIADQSKTADTTLADDAILVATLSANKKYKAQFTIYTNTAAAPDLKYDLNFTGTTTSMLARAFHGVVTTASIPTSTSTFAMHLSSAFNVVRSHTISGTDTIMHQIEVTVEVGATGGVLSYRWAQDTSSATAVVRRRNSCLEVTEM
jgi:hypothetical protein